jgi:hypothetical protein
MNTVNIPAGYQTVMPYIIISNATKFLSFMEEVFGAKEKMKHLTDDNEIMHAEVTIGDLLLCLQMEGIIGGRIQPDFISMFMMLTRCIKKL